MDSSSVNFHNNIGQSCDYIVTVRCLLVYFQINGKLNKNCSLQDLNVPKGVRKTFTLILETFSSPCTFHRLAFQTTYKSLLPFLWGCRCVSFSQSEMNKCYSFKHIYFLLEVFLEHVLIEGV